MNCRVQGDWRYLELHETDSSRAVGEHQREIENIKHRRGDLPRPYIFFCGNSSSSDGAGATLQMKR